MVPKALIKKRKRRRAAVAVPPSDLLPRDDFLAAAKDYFSLLTRPIIESRTPRTSGLDFARQYTRMVDTIVAILFQRSAERHGLASDETGIAVIAMGGYGRSELAPHSDIDILILCQKKTPLVEKVAGSFIRLMWDMGFELGHTVESLVESESALAEEMDTKTALIESRWVCGSRKVARAVERQIARIRRRDREAFLRHKINDMLQRYARYGNSFQLIEPNIKLSPGGLRDYQTLVWLGQVGRSRRGLGLLRQKGLLLTGEQRELEAAYDFLLRVRIELHLRVDSKQEQLTVKDQQVVAKALGYKKKGARLGVEMFMREYYRHSRAIYRISEDILDALGRGDNVGVMVGQSRVDTGDMLNVPLRRAALKKAPLSVFAKQKETGQKLDRGLRRRMEVVLREDLKGAGVLNAMRRSFVELIRDDHNVALVVRSLHDTQFLMRIIPEYDQLTCLKRYDLYHHYTVDEHSFKVLEHIAGLGGADADTSDRFVRLYSEIPDKRVLFLAALLHDVGKIRGSGHAKKGAAMAKTILARMFLPRETIDLVCFLIEQHLIMSHYSQRRDTSDLGTISSFCDTVKNRENLKYLCLLTYADYKATSPEVWNEWKGTLLWELYIRGYAYMMKQEKQPEAVYKQHKTQLLDAFSKQDRPAVLEHLDLLPGGYLLTMSAEAVREHMRMIAALDEQDFALHLAARKDRVTVTFCTEDKPYRLSELCGALALSDMNILHAFAFTRKDGKVIDVFDVESIAGTMTADDLAASEGRVSENLAAILSGERDPGSAAVGAARKWRRAKTRDEMHVPIKINFENDVAVGATIIDIFAPDQPGILYKITRTLSSLGLGILRARISTEGARVIDSFYVCNDRGESVGSAETLKTIRQELIAAVTPV